MDKEKIQEMYIKFNRVQNQYAALKRNLVATDGQEPIYASEMQVLIVMQLNPGYTVSDIADDLYITKSAASQLIKRLTRKGYIAKERNLEDERITLLALTQTGKFAVKAFLENESYPLSKIFKRLDSFNEEQMKNIVSFLNILDELFEKELK